MRQIIKGCEMTSQQIISAWLRCGLALAGLFAATPAIYAQAKWARLAPFPERAEEILGAAAGGKMYVFAGLAPAWKPVGMVYEYDPAGNQWTKKKPMALASHHVAFTEYHGKIYAFGGFVFPQSGPPAWGPIDNAWEYDPATDAWKALAPLPTKRGSAMAAVLGGKIYVIGGAPLLPRSEATPPTPAGPPALLGTVQKYDPPGKTRAP